ncbi:MAG TPA: 50S ribosomal protein L23 [Phycisphaerales bacterium]|jgi:large subunit ribosomal protein L23|nr:50S ribosomal protein L23 [Phycisphaerales bacterium]
MEAHYVIKRPAVTEKGTFAMNEQNRYTFEVDPRATKNDIKTAIESLYKVKVARVNTLTRRGKFRRMKYGLTQMPATKTAIVKLEEGSTIELF